MIGGEGGLNTFGRRVHTRIFAQQSSYVGQNDQKVRFDQISNEGPEGVVVAKTNFVGSNRIVFVNDRNNGHIHERFQSRAGIQVALTICKVVMGQKNHGRAATMLLKRLFIGLHQTDLPNRSCGLQAVYFIWATGPAKSLAPLSD